MSAERPSPDLDDAKFRAALARHLGITPTEHEQAHGFAAPASLIDQAHDRGDHWLVVTHRAGKHAVPKTALPKYAG